ncbi:MAG: hypothetical protein LAO03_02530 [Acidobacteriia bacterium]|nr:hypothetical protein [Terriglobia bacterium]
MSQVNGDKSRFNRKRKQNIARRQRNRKLIESLARRGDAASASPAAVSLKKATS